MNLLLLRSIGAIAAVALVASYFQGVQSGLLDPITPNLFTCPFGPIPNVIPCNADCREQHNASQGVCDDQDNCICSGPGIPRPTPELLTTCNYNFTLAAVVDFAVPLCHCMSDATPALAAFLSQGCDWDCQCHHGAASGVCNFQAKVCNCDYPVDLNWQWAPPAQLTCTAAAWVNITTCVVGAAETGAVPPGC